MTNTHTWTDNVMETGVAQENPDAVNECLMHLKYNGGGLFPTNNLGTMTTNFSLDINKVNLANITSALTISLPIANFLTGFENKCILDFSSTITTGITVPTGCKWKDGAAPTIFSNVSGVRNVLVFTTYDGGITWSAEYYNYGGSLTTFIRPVLNANGLMGGASFAARISGTQTTGQEAYRSFDNNPSTYSAIYDGSDISFYNPIPLKVSELDITNYTTSQYNIINYTVYGSNDDILYTSLVSGTNTFISASQTWGIAIPSANQGFYKYYRLLVSSHSGNVSAIIVTMNIQAQYIAI